MLGILFLLIAYVQGHCFWCVGYLPADMDSCRVLYSHTIHTVTPGFLGASVCPFIHIRKNTVITIAVSSSTDNSICKVTLTAYTIPLNSSNSFPEGRLDIFVSRKGFPSLSCLKWCTDKMQRQVAALRCINPLLPSIKTSDLQISDFTGVEATQLN